jgi:hypothetical protein
MGIVGEIVDQRAQARELRPFGLVGKISTPFLAFYYRQRLENLGAILGRILGF